MNFFTIVCSFFIIFFSLQFFIGRAGIISLIQEKYVTERIAENYNELVNIQKELDAQIHLAEHSKRYLEVFAHRVGLLAENEVYVHLENAMFHKGNNYSPGTLILFEESFYISNNILFFISIAVEALFMSLRLYRKNLIKDQKTHISVKQYVPVSRKKKKMRTQAQSQRPSNAIITQFSPSTQLQENHFSQEKRNREEKVFS